MSDTALIEQVMGEYWAFPAVVHHGRRLLRASFSLSQGAGGPSGTWSTWSGHCYYSDPAEEIGMLNAR